jgi:Fe-S-cluster containining protein
MEHRLRDGAGAGKPRADQDSRCRGDHRAREVCVSLAVTEDGCRTCGACCVSSQETPYGWADVTDADVEKMSKRVRIKLVNAHFNGCHLATPTQWRDDLGCAPCGFRRGTPGRSVSCSIYETRPQVCRRFRPGSRACREARREQKERLEEMNHK